MIIALVIVAVVLVLLGVGVWLLVRSAQTQQSRAIAGDQAMLDHLGAAPPAGEPMRAPQFFRFGRAFDLHILRGKAPSLCLAARIEPATDAGTAGQYRQRAEDAPLAALPAVTLRRETRRDRFGKWLGFNRELQLGDEHFDRNVYVESDAADADLYRLLAHPHARGAVPALLDLGCQWLEVNHFHGGLVVQWAKERWPSPAQVEAAAGHLAALAQALPPVASVRPAGLTRGGKVIVAGSLTLVVGFGLMMAGEGMYPPIADTAYLLGAGVGLALWCGAVLATLVVVRGRSNGLRAVVAAVLLFGAGAPLSSMGSLLLVNGVLDGAKRRVRTAEVESRWYSSGSKSTSYFLAVRPWPPHREPITLSLSYAQYARAPSQGLVGIRTGRGALGYEWFDDVVGAGAP